MMPDRQERWLRERLAYLHRLLQAAEKRGDHRAVREHERTITNLSTFAE